MTDRISAYTVYLSSDMREEDAEAVLSAIRMVKGVMGVDAHYADPRTAVIEMRVRRDLEAKVMEMFRADH